MKLVVCDDDATLRSVVSRLAEGIGHTVIAETDRATDAVELVVRFGADGLVLDLSMPFGSGVEAVTALRERAPECRIVVFTSYADETPQVREAALRAVVDKPDFERLEEVLRELAEDQAVVPEGGGPERRRPPRPRPELVAPGALSPSGLEAHESFEQIVRNLCAADAVLYVVVTPSEGPVLDPWDRLLHTDRFLAVARTLRTVLRVQDRLTAEDDLLSAVLLDAERAGLESAWRRLERAHEQSGVGGIITAGWAMPDGLELPQQTRSRARDAARLSVGQPPGDRLWAG